MNLEEQEWREKLDETISGAENNCVAKHTMTSSLIYMKHIGGRIHVWSTDTTEVNTNVWKQSGMSAHMATIWICMLGNTRRKKWDIERFVTKVSNIHQKPNHW